MANVLKAINLQFTSSWPFDKIMIMGKTASGGTQISERRSVKKIGHPGHIDVRMSLHKSRKIALVPTGPSDKSPAGVKDFP